MGILIRLLKFSFDPPLMKPLSSTQKFRSKLLEFHNNAKNSFMENLNT